MIQRRPEMTITSLIHKKSRKGILLLVLLMVCLFFHCYGFEKRSSSNQPSTLNPQVVEITKGNSKAIERDEEWIHPTTTTSEIIPKVALEHQVITLVPMDVTYHQETEYTRALCAKMTKAELAELRFSLYLQAGYDLIYDYKSEQLFKEKIHLASPNTIDSFPLKGKPTEDARLFFELEQLADTRESLYIKEELSRFKFFNMFRWSGSLCGYYLKLEDLQPYSYQGGDINPGIFIPQPSSPITATDWEKMYQEKVNISSLPDIKLESSQPTFLYYVLYYDYRHEKIRAIIPQPFDSGNLMKDQYGPIDMYTEDGRLYRTIEHSEGDILHDIQYHYYHNQLIKIIVSRIKDAKVLNTLFYKTQF